MTDYIRKKDAKEKYTHLLSVAESLNTHVSPDFLDNIPPVTMFDICKECNSDSYDNGFLAGYESAKNDLHDTSRPQGEWINPSENPEFSNREFFYDCSICGNTQMDETRFCPNCGADMRGGDSE